MKYKKKYLYCQIALKQEKELVKMYFIFLFLANLFLILLFV
jgi:hypothetical protein